MSEKEKVCNHHKNKRRKIIRRCFSAFLILAFLILLAVLIVWAVLQPTKPKFILQDATIFVLNVTAPNVISIILQVTVTSRNPNDRIGIYYDKMYTYTTYRNQQITYYTIIPAVYQGHKDYNVWSPFMSGTDIPVAPYNGIALEQDQNAGSVVIKVKLNTHVRWKVGLFTSGRYNLHVTCPVTIPLGNGKGNGILIDGGGAGVKYQIAQSCSVSV